MLFVTLAALDLSPILLTSCRLCFYVRNCARSVLYVLAGQFTRISELRLSAIIIIINK